MMIPADVEADVISVLPPDVGAIVTDASRRCCADDPIGSRPNACVPLEGWPEVTPARAWLSCEATCACLSQMLLQWRFGLSAHRQGPYEQASARIDLAVRRHLLAQPDVLQLRVLDGLEVLKTVALEQAGPLRGPQISADVTLNKRSHGWMQSARGYVQDGRDLRNAVVYTAVVLHLELGPAPLPSELSEFARPAESFTSGADSSASSEALQRQQLLAIAAAGGCHVTGYQHDWMRRTVRANVAAA